MDTPFFQVFFFKYMQVSFRRFRIPERPQFYEFEV